MTGRGGALAPDIGMYYRGRGRPLSQLNYVSIQFILKRRPETSATEVQNFRHEETNEGSCQMK